MMRKHGSDGTVVEGYSKVCVKNSRWNGESIAEGGSELGRREAGAGGDRGGGIEMSLGESGYPPPLLLLPPLTRFVPARTSGEKESRERREGEEEEEKKMASQ